MELCNVVKVEEMESYSKVNEYLALGWKLLAFYTTAYDAEGSGSNHQSPHYVLGWHEGEPVYPPKTDLWGDPI